MAEIRAGHRQHAIAGPRIQLDVHDRAVLVGRRRGAGEFIAGGDDLALEQQRLALVGVIQLGAHRRIAVLRDIVRDHRWRR